jgi:desulfoferrodoxin (superoxide reductase-like protein)
MKTVKSGLGRVGLFSLLILLAWYLPSWADVPTLSMEGPDQFVSQQPFSITLRVVHHGNNFIHHISKLAIYVDGKEAKVWTYNWKNYPREESWSVSHELTLAREAKITAIATCNLHGPSKEASLEIVPSLSR